jgi:hypothetical protein
VYLISEDSTAQGTYRHLTDLEDGYDDPTGSLFPILDLDAPFASLERNETLHIIVHGGGGQVEGMGPAAFAEFLVGRGLDPDKHRGTIRLISCFSGTRNFRGSTFVEDFAAEMRKKGFTNPMIGFDGLVRAASGGRILVVEPANVDKFFKYSAMTDLLKSKFEELKEQKPTTSSTQEEIAEFMQKLEDIKKKHALVTKKLSELWVPQSIGKNIVHIPEVKEYVGDMPMATLWERMKGDREWEDWQTQQMRAFNMIGEGESIKPRTDFSSEYIS